MNIPISTSLFDPYLNYRFRVRFSGVPIPILGVKKVSALKRTTASTAYISGGEPGIMHKVPGETTYDPITLERGVTHSPEFMAWACTPHAMAQHISSLDFFFSIPLGIKRDIRRDLVVEVLNRSGIPTLFYRIYGAWVSEFQAMSDMDGEAGNTVLVESLKLEHDGWEFLDPVAAASSYLPL